MLSTRNLRRIAPLALITWSIGAYAVGLGAIDIQSSLGQPLRASVPLLGTHTEDYAARCIRAQVESLDGNLILTPQTGLVRSGPTMSLQLTTRQSVNEPALNILVGIDCGTSIQRKFQILLDPAPTVEEKMPRQTETRAARDADKNTAPPQRKIQPEMRAKAAKAPRNVLRLLTPGDLHKENVGAVPLLQHSDALSTPHSAHALIRKLQSEVEALRIETERLKQQSRMEKAELESMRDTSLNWIIGLAILITVCLGSIAWLLCRFVTMQKTASQIPWNELDTTQEINTLAAADMDIDEDSPFISTGYSTSFLDALMADTVPGDATEQTEHTPTTTQSDNAIEFVK